jgi:hypothetical protein
MMTARVLACRAPSVNPERAGHGCRTVGNQSSALKTTSEAIGATIADMDDGPRIRQLTRLSHLEKKRFELEWVPPLELGLETHVMLYNLETQPPEAVAGGDGANEAKALLDLWTILPVGSASSEATTIVAEAYEGRTGRQPG